MICRYCSQEIADGSIFCSFCGERLARKKKGKKETVKVPEPRQLPSGSWTIQLRKEGVSITEPTREACLERARATRAGYVKIEKAPPKRSLGETIDKYIEDNKNLISPSTLNKVLDCPAQWYFKEVRHLDSAETNFPVEP